MPNCGCAGQTCGCKIQGGSGALISGTGTVKDPYVVSVNPATLNLGSAIQVSNSNTIEFSKMGSGGSGDPLIISGNVIIRSPDNSKWTLTISNSGVLTPVKV